MFLDSVPIECHIINGKSITWSRFYLGCEYIFCHISFEAAYTLNKSQQKRFYDGVKNKINEENDGTVYL